MKQSLITLGTAFMALTLLVGCGPKKKKVKVERSLEEELMMDDVDLRSIAPEEDYIFDENFEDVDQMSWDDQNAAPVQEAVPSNELMAENDQTSDELFAYTPESENKAYQFHNVEFEYNRDAIKADQLAGLQENIETAKRAIEDGKNIELRGYRCQLGKGKPVYNMNLSQRAANVVKDELVKNGIPEDRIIALGCGQENPLVSSHATDRETLIQDLSPNRRVEFSAI